MAAKATVTYCTFTVCLFRNVPIKLYGNHACDVGHETLQYACFYKHLRLSSFQNLHRFHSSWLKHPQSLPVLSLFTLPLSWLIDIYVFLFDFCGIFHPAVRRGTFSLERVVLNLNCLLIWFTLLSNTLSSFRGANLWTSSPFVPDVLSWSLLQYRVSSSHSTDSSLSWKSCPLMNSKDNSCFTAGNLENLEQADSM